MKLTGLALLLVGFLWLAWDSAAGFAVDQHAFWIARCQQLPPGEMIKRGDAVTAMRGLSLALKDRHRQVILPAALMALGGVIGTFSGRKQNARKH